MARRKKKTGGDDGVYGYGAGDDVKPVGMDTSKSDGRQQHKVAKQVGGVISGDILGSDRFRRFYPVVLYVSVLIFVYILHVYNHQRLQRLELSRRIELNEQRSRSVVFSSMRMNASRHSNIIGEINRRGLGLKESVTPPKYVGD